MSKTGKYQICVSGAAKGETVEHGRQLAEGLGIAIAKAGHTLLTGATTGLPEYAAESYKGAGGRVSLGISPAATKVEHIIKYRLPTKPYDLILYSGLHYVGRDALLINSADAVACVGGRMGTLHEITIALETETPVAILNGAGGISDEINNLLTILPNADKSLIIADTDPDRLIEKLTKALDERHKEYTEVYSG
ncbi:MAG TPA: hypothetical protein VIK37_00275 [Candidatus Saccharimonadales bacterium]